MSIKSHELPKCFTEWGYKFHHLGMPTNKEQPNEKYIPKFGLYTSGFADNPFGIEMMRYEKDSSIDKKIQEQPHIAFVVDDLDHELKVRGFNVLTPPNSPSDGARVAMIEYNGVVIELIEFR